MSINDDGHAVPANAPLPDSHGQAALLLVESLLHGLIARSILSTGDAIEIVESADSVQVELAEAADDASETKWHSHALLLAIASSLRLDQGDSPSQY